MPDDVLTISEVSVLMKFVEKTVYSLANAGELPVFKIRGQWRIQRKELEPWMDEQPGGGADANA